MFRPVSILIALISAVTIVSCSGTSAGVTTPDITEQPEISAADADVPLVWGLWNVVYDDAQGIFQSNRSADLRRNPHRVIPGALVAGTSPTLPYHRRILNYCHHLQI
ncbi:MAG TPA: hypothetical protein VGB30_04420 [bacterium]